MNAVSPSSRAWLGVLAPWLLLPLVLPACRPGEKPKASAQTEIATRAVLDLPMVNSTWPVRMATDTIRAPFESRAGWASLVMKRDYSGAFKDFSVEPPLGDGLFRVHLELAAAYRQAALLAAQATIQVYREDPREEDPTEMGCLIGISELLFADFEKADTHLAACQTQSRELNHSVASWKNWRKSGLKADHAGLSKVVYAELPTKAGTEPREHRSLLVFKDRVDSRKVQASDPSALLALSLEQEQAALLALPGSEATVRLFLDPWRLPLESSAPAEPPQAVASVPDALLFGSSLLSGSDLPFLSALSTAAPSDLKTLLDGHVGTSPLAASIAPCLLDNPERAADPKNSAFKLDTDCVINRALQVQDELRAGMVRNSNGEQGFHKPFAALGRLGVLRAAERLAARMNDERTQGLLIINSLDLSGEFAAEPHFLLSVAAWDAGNRNTLRAEDLLHGQETRVPFVEIARYPLDALHVRISRDSAPEIPMH